MDGSSSLDCWSSSLSVASDDSEAYLALSLMSAAAGFLVESKSGSMSDSSDASAKVSVVGAELLDEEVAAGSRTAPLAFGLVRL